MAFKKVAKGGESSTGQASRENWDAFYAHVEDVIRDVTEDGDSKNQVCFISGIVDTGTQTKEPEDKYTIYDWEDSERQHKLIAADFGCYEKEGKFYIPNKPEKNDSITLYVDFPSIVVDYGILDGSGVPRFLPYRELLAGEWEGIATHTALSSKGYGGKSRVNALAKATGLHKSGDLSGSFDVGQLLGLPFTMDIITNRGGDKQQYVNVKISNPSSKHKAIPVPEHDVEPFGIMMTGGNNPDDLKYIRKAVLRRLELADEWEDSELKKELEAVKGGSSKEEEAPTKVEAKAPAKTPAKAAPKKAPAKEAPPFEVDEEDEDDPFGG